MEMSILDVFVTCDKIIPFIQKMKIDEKRENTLTNVSAIKAIGRVIESDYLINLEQEGPSPVCEAARFVWG